MGKSLKAIRGTIALILLASLLAGCMGGKAEPSGNPETSATPKASSEESQASPELTGLAQTYPEFAEHHEVQLVAFEMGWTGPEKDLDIVTPELEKRTNLKLKYEPMTLASAEALNQKLNLMLASGEIPEVFFGSSPTDPATASTAKLLGKNNKIWDLSGMIKDYKNLYQLLEPELLLTKDKETGAIYLIPTQTGRGVDASTRYFTTGNPFVRADFLQQLNMDWPTTYDEFYTYLKRTKEEIKSVGGKPVIPLSINENLQYMEQMLGGFCPIRTGDFSFAFDDHTKKVENYGYTDSPCLMEAAKYMNKLYQEGLLDNEVLLQKKAQFAQKVSEGRVGAWPGRAYDMNTYVDSAKAVAPEVLFAGSKPLYAAGMPKYPDDKWTNFVGSPSSLMISKKLDEATVRHFLAVLDYLVGKEGQMLVNYGIEGETYTYDANGKVRFTDEFQKQTNDLDWNKAAAYGVFYWQQLVLNVHSYADVYEGDPQLLREDNQTTLKNQQAVLDLYEAGMSPPPSAYMIVQGPVETKTLPAIKSAKMEMWAKVITAKSEADVEKIVADWAQTCRNMGIDDVMKEKQAAFDERNAM